MNTSLEEVREALRKDDLAYVNNAIEYYMATAKSSLYVKIGYKESKTLPDDNAAAFETLSNLYIIEYVRSFIDSVDNSVTTNALIDQLNALYNFGEASDGDD